MVFELSAAREEILRKLAEQDWTPTELAEDIGKSRNAVYNHLNTLYEKEILTKEKVAAKTHPKTEYSIGDGFIQYITVLPGQFAEKSLGLTPEKESVIRIWSLPQEEYHLFVENYWWNLRKNTDVDYPEDIEAVAVYGSVARGDADVESDIDILVIVSDEEAAETVTEAFGSNRVRNRLGTKLAMTEVYTKKEYENSLEQGSQFLENIMDELHIIHDPHQLLVRSGGS
jgi:predicted nucleotidyltransferase/DNA-binding transcriptional ArsR family regulator